LLEQVTIRLLRRYTNDILRCTNYSYALGKRRLGGTSMTQWWPYTDEEWERLNYPEKFNKPVDKSKENK
jgi:hypothetical protein